MGKKHATSTSQVTIPPEVLARYNAVNKRAEETAAAPFQKYGTEASDFVAQMNAQQGAGIADINATAGSYQPYMGAANTATMSGMGPAYAQDLNIDRYMSPYIKNVADATGAMMRQQQEQAQSGNLGTAISSGAFGGDRAGIAAANLQQQNQMAYGKTMSDIMNQGYTQALQTAQQQQGVNLEAEQANLARQLQGGSQLAGLGAQAQQLGLQGAQAKIAAGTMQQQTEQAGKDALIKQFMQEKGYPFQVAQYLANIAMGTGALSGSTTTSTQPLGLFGNLATGGRVGGYADGGGVAGPMSDSQQDMWGEGYVPGGVLPVSQLMTAEVPGAEKKDNTDTLMKLASLAMGAKRGGTIDARHGYADGGSGSRVTPEEMELFRRRQALLRDPSIDMPQTGADPFRYPNPENSQSLVYGTEAPPAQLRPQAGLVAGVGAPAGGARAEAALPTRAQTSGEVVSAALHPLRQLGIGAGHELMGDVAALGGLGGAGLAAGTGAVMSALGAENYGGNYLMDLGSDMLDTSKDIYRHSRERADAAYNAPYIPATNSLPSGVAATSAPRPEISATGSIAGNLGLGAGAAGNAALPTSTLAPEVSPFPMQRPTGLAGASPSGASTSGVAPEQEDPVTFFNTKVIRQESGGNQLDRNGNPLTSPAGAVGIAQVMEATGPEAARLAGVEWDRNRWLYDKEYNKQIGQAYFLEQYRRFGSLDKAAAAYNAGPTALSQAMDRALALGGSYVDYLPAETQNYLKATTGSGPSGSAPSGLAGAAAVGANTNGAPASGLGGADILNVNKPYAERNMIGKFFHDPVTGKLDPVALKSVLGGLAAMAKSNTLSPVSALLQGLGGGMETYSAAQKQAADVAATRAGIEQTKVATSNARFSVGPDGMPMVIMPDGSRVDFYTFKDSPELQAQLGTAQTAAIVQAAENAGIKPDAGNTETKVYSTPAVQAAISSEMDTLRALGGDRTQSNEAIAAINSAAAAAGGGVRANTFLQLNAFADLNANPAAAAGGFKAPVRAAAVQAINYASSILGLPPISDMAEDTAIIAKASALLGMEAKQRLDADTLGALNVIMTSLPTMDQDPGASAKLMASIIQGQQRAVDLKNFTDGYIRRDNGNQTLTAFGAEKVFNDQTAQLYEAEKPYLETLIREGGKTVDPTTGMTPVQLLTSGQLSAQETAEVLAQLFPGGYPSHLVTTFSR